MLIFIQIIICPLAVAIISFPILRQVGKYDIRTGSLGLEMEYSDRYTETEMYKIQLVKLSLNAQRAEEEEARLEPFHSNLPSLLLNLRDSVDDELVKDYQRSEDFLIRWLREFRLDIKSASKSLRYALKWREENQMDFISNKTLPSIKNLERPCTVQGFDKGGGPILYFRSTGLNVRDLLLNDRSEALLQHFHVCTERFLQAGINHGVNGKQVGLTPGVAIVDVQGAVLKQQACLRCVEFYSQAVFQINKFYPRVSKLIVLINAPPFGRKVVEMMWPFLSQHHRETIQIFGTDRKEWTKFLLTVIQKDQLLQDYGGTNKLKS